MLIVAVFSCLADRVYDELRPEPLAPATLPAGVGSLSASTCAGCHVAIAEEWRGSMMGQAWTNPLFQAQLKEEGNPLCVRCHAPLYEQAPTVVTGLSGLLPVAFEEHGNPAFSSELRDEGVTCVTCHLDEKGALVGPHDVDWAPHAVVYEPDFAESDLCSRCHQMPEPPLSRAKRPLADTHGEHAVWQEATGRSETCVSCHMPAVTRPLVPGGMARKSRQHTFSARIGEGVALTLVDGAAVVENLAGHRVPTAEPMRAYVVRGYRGDVVEEVRLERKMDGYRDVSDTTLLPGEKRTVGFSFAAQRVELVYVKTTSEELVGVLPVDQREVVVGSAE